jgi:MULE transposase domain
MVTVHGLYNGFVILLTFCLLTGKTTAQYRQLLHHIQSAVQRNIGRNLEHIVTDLEASLKIAAETAFRNAVIAGCYFHFRNSLWRKIQKLGL